VGGFGARVARKHSYFAVEQNYRSAQLAAASTRSNGGAVVCGAVDCLGSGATFDLVASFEVLEHIEDDVNALRAWSAHLARDGLLLISSPGFEARFGAWDRRAGHFRRYEPEVLASRARAAGLEVIAIWTYGFPFGNALELLRHRIAGERSSRETMATRTGRSGRAFQPDAWLAPVTVVLAYPWCLIQRAFHSQRRGIGLVMLAGRSGEGPWPSVLAKAPRSVALR